MSLLILPVVIIAAARGVAIDPGVDSTWVVCPRGDTVANYLLPGFAGGIAGNPDGRDSGSFTSGG